MLSKIKTWHVAALFGLAYLIFGIATIDQYGISYDEEAQRFNNGYYNYFYITGQDKDLLRVGNEKYHGPAFEVTLILVEKALGLENKREIYLARHTVNFLVFFLSLTAMFFLGRGIFKRDKWGLFAALVYGLFPRFFAEAHYNCKDIIFLSFLVLSLYSLYRLANKPGLKWALFHAIITGYLIDVRIMGLFMPIATIVFVVYSQLISEERISLPKMFGVLGIYIIFQLAGIVAFWPIMWDGPVHHMTWALKELVRSEDVKDYFFWTGDIKYWGEVFKYYEIPRHYILGWMAVTIPILFQLMAAIGMVFLLIKGFSFKKKVHQEYGFLFLCFACWAGLLSVIIIKNPSVYDGWRHMYFLYALFVPVVTLGAKLLWEKLSPLFKTEQRKLVLVGFFSLMFIGPSYSIVSHHPFQFVYFNSIATTFFSPVEENFEMDYWGLGYRQGLEYILANNEGDVSLVVEHAPGYDNRHLLGESEASRLKYKQGFYEKGMYSLADYRAQTTLEPKLKSELVKKLGTPSGAFLWIYKTQDSLHIENVIYHEKTDFEDKENTLIDETSPAGPKVDWVGPEREYGYTVRKMADSTCMNGIFAARITGKFKTEVVEPGLSYVLSIGRDGGIVYWKAKWIGFIFNRTYEWKEWSVGFDDLEDIEIKEGDDIAVYMISDKKGRVFQDDVEITLLTYVREDFPSKKKTEE